MTLQDLKDKILNKSYVQDMLILKYEDTDFVPMQYVKAIQDIVGCELEFPEKYDDIPKGNNPFFDEAPTYVLKCDTVPTYIVYQSNIIIITKNVPASVQEDFGKYVVTVPKLEEWMVEDYAMSICKGITSETAKWFATSYTNLYKLTLELNKLGVFASGAQESLFKQFRENHVFSPVDGEQVMPLVSALQTKDMKKIEGCLIEGQRTEIDPMFLLSVLHGAFKRIMKVWLNKNPTPENTGLKSNQIYAIGKAPKVFSREKLIEIFEMLSLLDNRIKSGDFPMDLLVDYTIIKVLT